jgi:hypothetical protein
MAKRHVAGVVKELTAAPQKKTSNQNRVPSVKDYNEADLRAALERVLRLENDIAVLLRHQEAGQQQRRGAGVRPPWQEYNLGPVRTGISKQGNEIESSLLTSLIEDCNFCKNTGSSVPEARWTALERNDTFALNKSDDTEYIDEEEWQQEDPELVHDTTVPRQTNKMIPSLMSSLCSSTASGVPGAQSLAVGRDDAVLTRNKINILENVDEEDGRQEDSVTVRHTNVHRQSDQMIPSFLNSLAEDCSQTQVNEIVPSFLNSFTEDCSQTQADDIVPSFLASLQEDCSPKQADGMVPSFLTSLQEDCSPKQSDGMVPSFLTGFTEDCSFCNTTKSGVPEAPWVAEDRKDEECTEKKIDVDTGDDDETLVDVYKEEVDEEEATCLEKDAIECNWGFADRQTNSQKEGRGLRIMERLALERQNHKDAKRQQSAEKLQKRLEKLYIREQKIRALDKQFGTFNKGSKKSNRKTLRDDISYAVSMAHKSVITSIGLEVARFEL